MLKKAKPLVGQTRGQAQGTGQSNVYGSIIAQTGPLVNGLADAYQAMLNGPPTLRHVQAIQDAGLPVPPSQAAASRLVNQIAARLTRRGGRDA